MGTHKGKRAGLPFRDDLPTVNIARLRRSGAVTRDSLMVKVRFGDDEREVKVRHSLFPVRGKDGRRGSRSFFLCPSCANQAAKLRLLPFDNGRIACCRCDGGLIYRCQDHDSSNRIERLRQALYGPNPAKLFRKRLERALKRALIVERQARLNRAAL
jgi:hypothetical protein